MGDSFCGKVILIINRKVRVRFLIRKLIFIVAIMAVLAPVACVQIGSESGDVESGGEHGERVSRDREDEGAGEHRRSDRSEKSEGSGEHGGNSQSKSSESAAAHNEEDATQYALGDTFDQFRAGSRLVVSYDAAANAFLGTVENTTDAMLSKVRVEIHLSNNVELGPTPSVDLAPGEIVDVRLDATTQPFDTWSAHAEVGGGEGGHGSEGSGEHGGKGENEDSEASREHGGRSG